MNWLDKYIMKNDTGYLVNPWNGLFVELEGDFVRHVKGNNDPIDLEEISKDEFIKMLLE